MKSKTQVLKMEIGRIRFIISSYLRIRLEKIQHFIFHLLEEEEKVIYFCEMNWADSYVRSGLNNI